MAPSRVYTKVRRLYELSGEHPSDSTQGYVMLEFISRRDSEPGVQGGILSPPESLTYEEQLLQFKSMRAVKLRRNERRRKKICPIGGLHGHSVLQSSLQVKGMFFFSHRKYLYLLRS